MNNKIKKKVELFLNDLFVKNKIKSWCTFVDYSDLTVYKIVWE